ncbi:amino-acid acetyltransferase [Sorangium cellulosum]|uniref:Amino-acid acetyltransferase n=1 Tax=Sorangium cellulosum TaxID=56 RepID=A0A4P2Q1H1_SORCE|nr:GNAT family N-acetyltransferase [Sorangium cellulosum]AUX22756.1 amino-acid acetyltransferase [Sorangium cellulosum]
MHDERTAPQRIRMTGLQEAQLPALVALEQACTAMYHDIGFDAAEVPARTLSDLVALTRQHDVRVAEVDHEVVGYLAWRDEAPGVAYLEELSVHPDHQRRGIATRLIEELRERARELGMQQIVLRSWERASWAQAFYRKAGFARLGDDAPAEVRAWRSERDASGRPLTRPGEVILWATIAPKPSEEPGDGDFGAS